MLNKKKLSHYLDNNFNVLLIGTHGLSKTVTVKKVFEQKNLKWKYFSASTMDPWIDFIGVPKTVERNGKEVLELIKPAEFENDEVEAIFFDEFNRAPKKVVNAVMELIQFKSINGKEFKNLKVVWAAINPYDDESTYSVEKLDPATLDRFHIHINVSLELDVVYLMETYGETAKPFIRWWNELPQELKLEISPRRVDYAIQVHNISGDLRDVLPKNSNVRKLEDYIKETKNVNVLFEISKKSENEIKAFFNLENSIKHFEEVLNNKKISYLIRYFNKEFIEKNIQENKQSKTKSMLINHAMKDEVLFDNLTEKSKSIVKAATKMGGLVIPAKISFATEELIKKTLDRNALKGTKTFINKMNEVFKIFFNEISIQKSSEIYSFFDIVFDDYFKSNPEKLKQLQLNLANFKNKSTYIYNTRENKMFFGLFLNFIQKYNIGMANSYNGVIQEIYANFSPEVDSEFFLGYEEKYWFVLKELMNKKYEYSKFLNSKRFKDVRNLMIIEKTKSKRKVPLLPSSIEETRNYFQSNNLTPNESSVSLEKPNLQQVLKSNNEEKLSAFFLE